MKSSLRQCVRLMLEAAFYEPNGKRIKLSAANMTDLGLAVNWLRLNSAVWNVGVYRFVDGIHVVNVTSPLSKNELKDMIATRFGSFVDVE